MPRKESNTSGARSLLDTLQHLETEQRSREQAENQAIRRRAALTAAKEEADRRLTSARLVAKEAREACTSIVRRVFNDDLNTVWRDFFVRVAPDEQFVPAFVLPDNSNGPVEAVHGLYSGNIK